MLMKLLVLKSVLAMPTVLSLTADPGLNSSLLLGNQLPSTGRCQSGLMGSGWCADQIHLNVGIQSMDELLSSLDWICHQVLSKSVRKKMLRQARLGKVIMCKDETEQLLYLLRRVNSASYSSIERPPCLNSMKRVRRRLLAAVGKYIAWKRSENVPQGMYSPPILLGLSLPPSPG